MSLSLSLSLVHIIHPFVLMFEKRLCLLALEPGSTELLLTNLPRLEDAIEAVGRPGSIHRILFDAYAICFKKDLSGEISYGIDADPEEGDVDEEGVGAEAQLYAAAAQAAKEMAVGKAAVSNSSKSK